MSDQNVIDRLGYPKVTIDRPNFLGGGQWQLEGLTYLTVVLGKNGSGKSLLLRGWRNLDSGRIHYIVPERMGSLAYEPSYLQAELTGELRRTTSERNASAEYRQRVVTRVQTYFGARGNFRGRELPGVPADLEEFLRRLLPDFEITLEARLNPPYRLIRHSSGERIENIDSLSSGEAQLLIIGLDVLTVAAIWQLDRVPVRLMLIDEPDAHIHPDLQVRFADFLIEVSKHFSLQIVVATHSTTFMAALGQFGGEDSSVLYLNRLETKYVARKFTAITRELTACLGGHVLMGPLFSVPLLLVEGDDDYRIWSQAARHHVTSFSVIPCDGDEIKRFRKSLEQILSALRDANLGLAGYALIDADKGKPQSNSGDPQDQIKYIQLACRESENLYLTDEVLAELGLDWPTAISKIEVEAEKYGGKAQALREARAWDRKSADTKDCIRELEQILDSKGVHWTLRVAQVIGRARPKGQIGEFLGAEVVNALWGQPKD